MTDFMQYFTWAVTVGGPLVGVYAYGKYMCDRRKKDRKLICHLKKEKEKENNKGQRTIVHLMARVGLTKDEILQASYRNHQIYRTIKKGEDGFGEQVLFEYRD